MQNYRKAAFTIDQINKGDQVYFESKLHDNYDLYWTVLSKLGEDRLEVEIQEMGRNSRNIIYISEVKLLISTGASR